MAIPDKIEYCGNVYEYIGTAHNWIYFQSVNDDTYIRFHVTTFYSHDIKPSDESLKIETKRR